MNYSHPVSHKKLVELTHCKTKTFWGVCSDQLILVLLEDASLGAHLKGQLQNLPNPYPLLPHQRPSTFQVLVGTGIGDKPDPSEAPVSPIPPWKPASPTSFPPPLCGPTGGIQRLPALPFWAGRGLDILILSW